MVVLVFYLAALLFTYLLTYYVLTYSMEQNSSWEANRFSANQEIPCILWNLTIHYCIYKSLVPVPILSQINPNYAPPIPLP